jgi:hypothetical protein
MTWRKSSYSGGANGSCVELASGNGTVSVRDTAQAGDPNRLTIGFSASAWATFTESLR